MSKGNIMAELQQGQPAVISGTTPLKLIPIHDSTYGTTYCLGIGTDVPGDNEQVGVWTMGALFIHTDGDDGSALYTNEQLPSEGADFNLITVA